MNIAIFGSFGRRMLAAGWVQQSALAFLGGGDFDLTGVEPGPGAQLTAIAVFGGIDIIVDEGTQVTMDGFSLFGSREVEIVPAGVRRPRSPSQRNVATVESSSAIAYTSSPFGCQARWRGPAPGRSATNGGSAGDSEPLFWSKP